MAQTEATPGYARHAVLIAACVAALLALIPSLNMVSRGGGSIAFYLALVLSIGLLVSRLVGRTAVPEYWSRYRRFTLGMAIPLVGVLICQLAMGDWSASDVERALRLGPSVCLLLWVLLSLPESRLRLAVHAILLAGLIGAIHVGVLSYQTVGRPATGVYNAVGYANLILLFAALGVYSLAMPLTRHVRVEAALKIAFVVLACVAVVLTQTRSSWLAFPVFAGIAFVLFAPRLCMKRMVGVVLGATVLVMMLASANAGLRDRAGLAWQQVQECAVRDHPIDSSACIRFQLWRAAWTMFEQSPWFGNGSGARFRVELQTLRDEGMVSDYVAAGFGEPHNDIMMALASYGILGLIGLGAIYLLPAVVFARRLVRQAPQGARAAAAMGLALCVGFLIFGQMELMFRSMRTVSMYAGLIALFLALSHSSKRPTN